MENLIETAQVVALPRLHAALHYDGSHQVPLHVHRQAELVMTLEGLLSIECGGKRLDAGPGVLYVLPSGVPHNQTAVGVWHTLCIIYSHGRQLLDETPRTLDIGGDAQLLRWFEDLAALHAARNLTHAGVCDGLLFAALARLRQLEHQQRAAEALHPRLAAAVRFLQEHVTEPVDADTLALQACASYSHLSALFRARFGCAPLKFQQRLRLELGCKLLANPYISIDEVARQAGYQDTNYFVRLFRRAYGMPPGRWRRQSGTPSQTAGSPKHS